MHDLQNFSDEVFIIVDCASIIINKSLAVILNKPLPYIKLEQQVYLYVKKLQYETWIIPLKCTGSQLCEIIWDDTFSPIGSVLFLAIHNSDASKEIKLYLSLKAGLYDRYIAHVCKAFGTNFVDTPLEHE